MKILLIRPKPHNETIGLQSIMVCEPLELMTLKAILTQNNFKVKIIDMILENKPIEFFIKKYSPDYVGITGYISHVNVIKSYAKKIKNINPKIKIIVGGVHAAVCPNDFSDKNIDFVSSKNDEFFEYMRIKNMHVVLPDRNLPKKYRKKYYYLFHDNCALIKTSFGCPYNCNFCFCKEISDYIPRVIDDVIAELKTIKQKEIYIVDDDFLFNRKRLNEFIFKIRKNNLHKRFLVYGRADFIAKNEDIIKKLKEIGLRAVIVGLESDSQAKLDSYNKKTKLNDNLNAVRILQKYDIECYGTLMLDPSMSIHDFYDLYKLIELYDLKFVNLQPFTPMPNTPYFEECKNDLLVPFSQKEKWDMAHIVLKPKKISVRRYYFEIIKLYYKITFRPKSIFYIIKKYGFLRSLKLSAGSTHVSIQYILKMIRG